MASYSTAVPGGSVETRERTRRSGETYLVYVAVPWDPTLQRKGKKKTYPSFDEARAHCIRARQDADELYGSAAVQGKRRMPLAADFADEWADTAQVEETTRVNLRAWAKQVRQEWPALRIDEIDRKCVLTYLAKLRDKGLTVGTKRAYFGLCRSMLTAAVADGHITVNPCGQIKSPGREATRTKRCLTSAELDTLLDRCDPDLKIAVLLARDAGLRMGEACGLRWSRVDLTAATVEVADVKIRAGNTYRDRGHPKGKKIKAIPLSQRLVRELRDHQSAKGGYVLGGITPGALQKRFHRAVTDANLGEPRPSFHHLRHTALRALQANGAPPSVLQGFARHATLQELSIYLGAADADEMRRWFDDDEAA